MNTPRSIVRGPAALCLLLIVLPLTGCWFSHGVSRDRAASVDPKSLESIVWPQRDMEIVRDIAEATPERIFRYRITDPDLASERILIAAETPDFVVHRQQLTEHGLFRIAEQPPDESGMGSFHEVFEGFIPSAFFVSSLTLRPQEVIEERLASRAQSRSELEGAEQTDIAIRSQIESGIAISLPSIDDPESVRGIVLYFRGLMSTEYEEAFSQQIVDSDWAVIRIGTHSKINSPRDAKVSARFEEHRERSKELMEQAKAELGDENYGWLGADRIIAINRQVNEELPYLRPGFELADQRDAAEIGMEIAQAVDDTLAENAYAAEAAIDAVIAMHPRFADIPVAVVGCSAGAMVAPAVAERLGDRVDALVLIGGGADIMRIDRDSTMGSFRRLEIYGEDENLINDELWERVHHAYRDSVQLDPLVLGPRLRHIPTLIIRAGFDKWVPASTGSELVRAFGKPDRDWHPGGHQTLFYFLKGRAPRVLRWLDRNTPEPALESERPATVAP